jgi:hypothetical protein
VPVANAALPGATAVNATSAVPETTVAPVPAALSSAPRAPAAVSSAQPAPAALSSASPVPAALSSVGPVPSAGFHTNNSLAPIHALLAPPTAFIKLKQPPAAHRFFDARNTLGLASLGASLTADALSTQKGLAYPGFTEMNPIARPFVQTRTGAAAYNAGSFGLLAGIMYWAHRTEHHKLERILPFAVGSWEGLLSFRNYRVIANRPR